MRVVRSASLAPRCAQAPPRVGFVPQRVESGGSELGSLTGGGLLPPLYCMQAYTSQIVAITMLALALSDDKLSKSARRQEIIRSLLLLPSAIERTLKLEPQIIELAKELVDEASLLLFGRGFQYATALEVRRGPPVRGQLTRVRLTHAGDCCGPPFEPPLDALALH